MTCFMQRNKTMILLVKINYMIKNTLKKKNMFASFKLLHENFFIIIKQ